MWFPLWIKQHRAPLVVLLGVIGGVWWEAPHSQAAMRENFESPETSWRFAAADAPYRLHQHQRVGNQSHWGHGSEQLRLALGAGTYAFVEHDIDQPRVIEELKATVWVKSDRPGVQLFARVVFPRAKDNDGQPVTALIQGSAYTNAGAWQQLSVAGIPDLVGEQARVLRLQLRRDIDPREAYLDRVLLNLYSGPGIAEVFVDDLEVEGHIRVGDATGRFAPPYEQNLGGTRPPPNAQLPSAQAMGAQIEIELQGAVLQVDGQPIFPRIIEHRGESFEFLKRLGFNGVKLSAPPTPWQLAEAQRHEMWLVAPPPDVQSGRAIGPSHHRVLAWHLGNGLGGRQVDQMRELAVAVRRADEQSGRPIVLDAEDQLRSYSRIANIMLLSRSVLGTSFELTSYRDWFHARKQILRPGTPAWATIQTQPPAMLLQQAHVRGVDGALNAEPQQIRLLTLSAIAAGARGIIMTSYSRLDGEDEASLMRAQALELVNRELDIIEPWLAICGHVAPLAVGEAGVQASMFATQHSQLILLTQTADHAQFVTAPPATQKMSMVVPGVAESSDAYILSPTGIRPLDHRRVTGGIGVAIDDLDLVSAVLFTGDPLAYARVAQTVASNRMRTAELQLLTTINVLRETKPLLAQQAQGRVRSDWTTALGLVEANLNQGQRMLSASDAPAASAYARRASYSLAELRRECWKDVVQPGRTIRAPSEMMLPLAMAGRLQSANSIDEANNRIPSGNMESLQQLLNTGWRNYRHDHFGVQSAVELSPVSPNTGEFSLRMQATRSGPEAAAQLETSPIWIRSPEVNVHPGQQYVVQGWIRLNAALAGSTDGVVIFDTQQGRELALRIPNTSGWQPFRMEGTATRHEPLAVNIELTGIGEAYLDDIEILLPGNQPVREAPVQQQQPSTARRLRELIRLPR